MQKSIALIVTVDTKEAEAHFLRDFIEERGFKAPVLDVSTRLSHKSSEVYPCNVVCEKGGATLEQLSRMRRDDMMQTMGEGSGRILLDLYSKGELGGVISVGGNQGTAIASIAMRMLPVGVPKLIISTVASGNVRPYVEYKDILMMFSVADFLGADNFISRTILTNGAGAVMGMAQYGQPLTRSKRPVIATTAFGNTDPAVAHARRILESKGYEVVSFHASGAGGSALEYMVENGYISGVLDMTTHEVLAEVCGDGTDIYTPLRPRLVEAGKKGIPQVVVPGAIEYFCFGAPDTIPERYRQNMTHYHNPYNTNVRASAEELVYTAKKFAEKLNASKGPVAVLLPLQGFSANGHITGTLYQPETDKLFIEELKKHLDPKIELAEYDNNINDAEVSTAAADKMIQLMEQ